MNHDRMCFLIEGIKMNPVAKYMNKINRCVVHGKTTKAIRNQNKCNLKRELRGV
jgi:hypothetical protein